MNGLFFYMATIQFRQSILYPGNCEKVVCMISAHVVMDINCNYFQWYTVKGR